MCTYSMIVDHYREKWTPLVPGGVSGGILGPQTPTEHPPFVINVLPAISPEEIAEFRKLLERAREYDRLHNEPHCDLQEKKDAIKRIADALGVDVSFV